MKSTVMYKVILIVKVRSEHELIDKLDDIHNKEIGNRLRREREKLELTREKFAEIVNLSVLYIGQLERGERQMSLPTLVKIADSLHVTTDYLIYGKGINSQDYIKENSSKYIELSEIDDKISRLNFLLSKCSKKELDLIERMVKLIIPYIK
ncbi:anaerobic benzoate catabolism transcriptional regulator [Clostridium tyrobutyricum]|jgi:transcriptional regulator with XRE-family HTH domain|nr:anaerobic benzoate catabolism transcriptional regulator [Clostridium tyrobutyricum]